MKDLIYLIIIVWLLSILSTTNKELKINYDAGYIDGYMDGIKTQIKPL